MNGSPEKQRLLKALFSKEYKSVSQKVPEAILLDYAFYKGMEKKNNLKYKVAVETSIYCTIIQSDLMLTVKNLRLSTIELEKKFYARILSLTIYEYLKDLSSILGGELVNELKENDFIELIDDVYILNKEFSDLRKIKEVIVKTIRHETIAHKERNKIELIEQIFNIKEDEIYELGLDLIKLNNKLIAVSSKIRKRISEFHKINGQLKTKK